MIYAARSLGLGSTPMIGSDAEAVHREFVHAVVHRGGASGKLAAEVAPSGRRGERVHGAHPVDCRPDFSPAGSDGVALAVREVIARVDVPDGAGAQMAGVENTVDDGVA
jgi:hypothetical protein